MPIPNHIQRKVGACLHNRPNHPVEIVKRKVRDHLGRSYRLADDLSPVVTVRQNFDDLSVPPDHVSRRSSDTYYLDDEHVLRTHTSAHLTDMFRSYDRFLVAGDVYRRDPIDRTHYPVFHQMEGGAVMRKGEDPEADLLDTLHGLIGHLFPGRPRRVSESYYSYSDPAFEFEVELNGSWVEVLGAGVLAPEVMARAGRAGDAGWAFGLGLDRLAMLLFKIPDIRLMWSSDERFLGQFADGQVRPFQSFGDHGVCSKEVSFYTNGRFDEAGFLDLVRTVVGDLAESVTLLEIFDDGTRMCLSYRVTYCPLDQFLSANRVTDLHRELVATLAEHYGVEIV